MHDDGEGKTYRPRIRYRYVVDGHAFEGHAVTIGDPQSSEESARTLVERALREPHVVVHYDPAQPSDAALVVGVSGGTYFKLAFAVTWLLFTFGFVATLIAGAFGVSPTAVESAP